MKDKPKAYTAWLVERVDIGYPLYWSGPSRGYEFTDNIEKAVKFRFEEDAAAVMKGILDRGRLSPIQLAARDHQWGFTDELTEGA